MSRRRTRKPPIPERSRRIPDAGVRTSNRWWMLPLFLAAVFAIKLTVLWQLQWHPLLQPEGALDSAEYVRLARRVIGGDVALGPGLYYLSPLYIYFVAAALSISDSTTFVRGLQALLGTAAVGCVFVAARVWFGTRAASFAAVLAALTGVFTFYEVVLFQASLDTFLTSAAIASLAVGLSAEGIYRLEPGFSRLEAGFSRMAAGFSRLTPGAAYGSGLALAGFLFGLQILNRPNVVVAVAGVTGILLIVRRWRAALWLAAGVAIALAPVVARNVLVSHQFALAGSQGGLNLYIGNSAQATGQYVAVPGVRANIAGQAEDTRRVAEQATGRSLTDAEVSSYFADMAMAWMREHPGAALKLFARKLALTFNARHQWLDFSYPYYAYDAGSSLWLLFVGAWLLVPLGLAGAIAGAPAEHRREYFVVASFVPLYAVSVAIFFVAERYRLPLLIALCPYSGAAMDQLLQPFLNRRSTLDPRTSGVGPRMSAAAVAAALVPAALLTAIPFNVPDGRFEERLRLSKALMNRGDSGGAVSELERAYALRPSDAVTEFNLGMAMVSSGRAAEGLAHVRHAVDAGVAIDGARYALASATLASGDRDGAVTLLRSYYPAPTDTAESCYQVGILALRAGAPRVAERYLRRALELKPGWPEALRALEQLGQP